MNNSNSNKEITSLLAEIASEVVGQFEMATLLAKIIKSTKNILNAEVCSIFLEDKENTPGVIKCVAGSGFAKNIVGVEYEIGEGLTGSIAEFGGEYNINGIKELKDLKINGEEVWLGKHDEKQWKKGENVFRNLIAIPLKIKNSTLGVIKAENKIPEFGDRFTEEDLIIFKTIANVIALTIENTKLVEENKKQSKVLTDIVSAVVGEFDMKKLLDQITATAMNTLHAEVCAIFLEDKENEPGIITCVAGSGSAENIIGKKYKSGEGITGTIFNEGSSYNSRNPEDHRNFKSKEGKEVWKGKHENKQWANTNNKFRNGIGLPLKIQDNILGVIKVENKIPKYGNFFTNEDYTLFQTIANVIALAIQNTKFHKNIQEKEKEGAWKDISFRAAHKMGNAIFGLEGDIVLLNLIVEQKEIDHSRLNKKAKEAMNSINEAKMIINEFKGYARPNEITPKYINLTKFLKNIVVECKLSIFKSIEIIDNINHDLPNANIDQLRIKNCLREIIENASQNMNDTGEIIIKANLSSNQELKSVGIIPNEKKFVSIIISDTGVGIDEENKNKIFHPFFSTRADGSGLGLSIVKQYIEKHDGKIIEQGKKGEGAKFLIVLPIN